MQIVTSGAQRVSFSGDGAFDYEARRGQFTLDLSSLGLPVPGGKAEMVLVQDVVYMKLPLDVPQLQARPWLKVDVDEVGRESGIDVSSFRQLQNNDPTASLNFLRGATEDAEKVGTEKVRDVETTRYRATLDLRKAAEQVSQDLKDDVERVIQQLGQDRIPTQAWVDGDGRLRRLEYAVDLSKVQAPATGAKPSGTLTTTVELYDFGVEVDAAEPPTDQVTDLSELLRR